MRNARCVATGDPPFCINSSTIKARSSPDHAMVYTENGTYTAVRRRAPHHCTPTQKEAMPHTNRGVISAAPSISVASCQQLLVNMICREIKYFPFSVFLYSIVLPAEWWGENISDFYKYVTHQSQLFFKIQDHQMGI